VTLGDFERLSFIRQNIPFMIKLVNIILIIIIEFYFPSHRCVKFSTDFCQCKTLTQKMCFSEVRLTVYLVFNENVV
jgi:hypothetical protein